MYLLKLNSVSLIHSLFNEAKSASCDIWQYFNYIIIDQSRTWIFGYRGYASLNILRQTDFFIHSSLVSTKILFWRRTISWDRSINPHKLLPEAPLSLIIKIEHKSNFIARICTYIWSEDRGNNRESIVVFVFQNIYDSCHRFNAVQFYDWVAHEVTSKYIVREWWRIPPKNWHTRKMDVNVVNSLLKKTVA
jgi:hypothetical protein